MFATTLSEKYDVLSVECDHLKAELSAETFRKDEQIRDKHRILAELAEAKADNARLAALNAELVAALEDVMELFDEWDGPLDDSVHETVLAALAKAGRTGE
jgi:hypothetical protein